MAFWGCEVTETKAAVVDVPEGFVLNVVNATCGASSADAQVALGLETQQLDGKAWKGAVAHLGAKQPLQVKLDLVFGHKVKFYLAKGSGALNLTGYFQPGPAADLLEEEETPKVEEAPKKGKKRAREEKKSWDEGEVLWLPHFVLDAAVIQRLLLSVLLSFAPNCLSETMAGGVESRVSPSSSDSEEVSEKKVKAVKPVITAPPAKKMEQTKEQTKAKSAETTASNNATSMDTSQKKKRKKNRNKKHAAANGEAK
ncbi:hypothetical protein PHYPSEUDO_014751 [Phytophthora pseudosyringae]|uniref:Nucleoplasmin-like domain-containing protein n=1 Tax=Phytophthora pseudosyringae TaxID=221518 RepID=A0A8T1W0D9_9STRA|nr:hypothetical protein PHYPSEUDO_014751 [Phytophthora pseudosyringae]